MLQTAGPQRQQVTIEAFYFRTHARPRVEPRGLSGCSRHGHSRFGRTSQLTDSLRYTGVVIEPNETAIAARLDDVLHAPGWSAYDAHAARHGFQKQLAETFEE